MKGIVTLLLTAAMLGGCAIVPLGHYHGDGYRHDYYRPYRDAPRYDRWGGYYRGHDYRGYDRGRY